MPTPEETMAYNQQAALAPMVNQQVDTAQQMLDAANHIHELFGLSVKPGSKDANNRLQELQRLRQFVEMKQLTPEYDPEMQLKAIDHEIQRLTPPKGGFKQPAVQSAEDNQRGK